MNQLNPVYHGDHGARSLKELARSYPTISQDLARIPPAGPTILSPPLENPPTFINSFAQYHRSLLLFG
jgi:hypothetical protein